MNFHVKFDFYIHKLIQAGKIENSKTEVFLACIFLQNWPLTLKFDLDP